VPDHPITLALLAQLGQPLLATTLILPGEAEPLNDPDTITEVLKNQIDAVIDAGACPAQPTTVIDLTGDTPVVVREGRGEIAALGLVLA
jgi:tRNA A37 threonylcarbamoyladenosine synthetase subunit TsaC/SUA5/YrdC